MKLSCEVVKDLLILYEDESCSEDSTRLVESHLKECKTCSSYLQKLRGTGEILVPDPGSVTDGEKEKKAIRQSFRKIRRRWAISLIALLMIFPLSGLGVMGYHEYIGEGIAFSNLDDIYRCMRFMYCIEKRDYERAVSYMSFPGYQYQYLLSISGEQMTMAQFQEYMRGRVLEKLQLYDALGLSIDNIHYDDAYAHQYGTGNWGVDIAFDEIYPDGSRVTYTLHLDSNTLRASSGSHAAGVSCALYLSEALGLYVEDDPLGYGDFPQSFVLEEGEWAQIRLNDRELPSDAGGIMLVNQTFGTPMDVKDALLDGQELRVSVPGSYALVVFVPGEDKNFIENVDIMIVQGQYREWGE